VFVFLNYNNNSGNGTTGAVQLLINCLGLKHAPEKSLVILGPFGHHSNLLPWRKLGNVDIEMVQYRPNGSVDLKHLEQILWEYQDRPVKISSFTAASNLTGTIADNLGICKPSRVHWDGQKNQDAECHKAANPRGRRMAV
jgi:selenocysteine lyase/cysteine desulfurase